MSFIPVDNDECRVQGACGNGTCLNTVGGFSCTCDDGFFSGPNEICEGKSMSMYA